VLPLCLHARQRVRASSGSRCVVGTAGCAAAGKTMWCEKLAAVCTALGIRCAVLNMDSYHFPNATLTARAHRADKGRPWTFDVPAFVADLTAAHVAGTVLSLPVYDRHLHEPVPNARSIAPDVDV
jgi:pantothenate kinase